MLHATVTFGGSRHRATPDAPVTFGRDEGCTICLDPGDTGVSRVAGEVHWGDGVWWLENRSRTRPLIVSDDQILRNVLPQGRRHPLDVVTRVVVDGTRPYTLIVTPHLAGAPGPAGDAPEGLPTSAGLNARVSDSDRLALAALFENYVGNPSRVDGIRSYEAAAARLGQSRDQVRRRVENLRERLYQDGARQLKGAAAMQHLAEFALANGLLTADDLPRLPPRS